MSIWKGSITLEDLNRRVGNTLVRHLGIEFTEIGADYLKATMPVDERTVQPFGVLHGGASLALAETLGSAAGYFCVDRERQYCVGMEINANHIRPVPSGPVYGVATPIHLGRKTHVWSISIYNPDDRLVCVSRITLSVLDKESAIGDWQ
jgi:1,4-dihydroxy-2-naphthoyl-CoA hydrolase